MAMQWIPKCTMSRKKQSVLNSTYKNIFLQDALENANDVCLVLLGVANIDAYLYWSWLT